MGNCCATKQGQKPYKTDKNQIEKVVRKKHKTDFDDLVKQDSEKVAAGARGQTINGLQMLEPKDGLSQPNSLLSSTVGDGTFLSNGNKNQLAQDGRNRKRNSPSSKYASLLSDIHPDELDENVPRESMYQRPKGLKIDEGPKASCDLTVPPDPKRSIYKITNEFPVQRPYSTPLDWQKVLSRHSMQQ